MHLLILVSILDENKEKSLYYHHKGIQLLMDQHQIKKMNSLQ